jgi:putative Mg2+ transporter-C (MgtC) family protein
LHLELLLRIAVATAPGAVIGLERQFPSPARRAPNPHAGRAGLVDLQGGLPHFVYFQHYHRDDRVTVDTSRIAASAVAGTGFLAGGAILRTGLSVRGLEKPLAAIGRRASPTPA